MDDNDKKLTIPLDVIDMNDIPKADPDEVKASGNMDDLELNECCECSMYAQHTGQTVMEVLNDVEDHAPPRDNARTRRRRTRQRNRRKLANQAPATPVANQAPSTSVAKLSPGTSAAKLSPGTSAAKLSPGASAAKLSPGASAAKLSPGASAAMLSPATSVANLSPATSFADLSLATSVANLSLAQPVAKRSPVPVPAAGRIRNNADLRQDLHRSTYICGICNIDVPCMYMEEHNSSDKHKTCQKLLKIAIERSKNNLNVPTTVKDTEAISRSYYFCEPCAIVVKQNKHEHELTRDHFKSLKHDRIMKDLLQIFIDKEYLEYVDFSYMRTEYMSSDFGNYDNDSDKDIMTSHALDFKEDIDESTYSV